MTAKAFSRGLGSALLLLSLLGSPVQIAQAHAVVVKAIPTDRATLSKVPPEIALQFNATLEKKLVHLKLERADGSSQRLTDIAPEPAVVRCTLPQDLIPGAYTLKYKVLATDGHATQGVLRFTLEGGR
jgi:methionine-rich copper-binding protein CopC